MKPTALIFGYGYIGKAFARRLLERGYEVCATHRDPAKAAAITADGIMPTGMDAKNIQAWASLSSAILITPPPDDSGCPAFAMLGEVDLSMAWVGYLSTTGVYGDRGGKWVFEDSDILPSSPEGRRRVTAENQWLSKGAHIFRLPGLYGPGRNVIERLRDGTARNVVKPDHVFSRLQHDDGAAALLASLDRPRAGGVYNLCDDEPAPASAVLAWAAREFGFALPAEISWDEPNLPLGMRRFYADNKRVSNALAKAELGWRPLYPTWREGLAAIWKSMG